MDNDNHNRPDARNMIPSEDGTIPEEAGSASGNRFRALELDRHIGERLRFLRRLSGFSHSMWRRRSAYRFSKSRNTRMAQAGSSAVVLAEFSSLYHLPMDWFIGPFNTCMERDNDRLQRLCPGNAGAFPRAPRS